MKSMAHFPTSTNCNIVSHILTEMLMHTLPTAPEVKWRVQTLRRQRRYANDIKKNLMKCL